VRVIDCDSQALRWIFPFSELNLRDLRLLDLGFIMQAGQRREHSSGLLTYGLYPGLSSVPSVRLQLCPMLDLLVPNKQIHTYGGSLFGMSARPVAPGPPIKSLHTGLF
jgi:hypothetical protein